MVHNSNGDDQENRPCYTLARAILKAAYPHAPDIFIEDATRYVEAALQFDEKLVDKIAKLAVEDKAIRSFLEGELVSV